MMCIPYTSPDKLSRIEVRSYTSHMVYIHKLMRDDIHRDEWTKYASSKRMTVVAANKVIAEYKAKGWKAG